MSPTKNAARRRSLEVRTRTAYHEAGHAVLSAAINDWPRRVSIRASHSTLGRSRQKMLAQPTSLAQVYLAGFAAEHGLTGQRPRAYRVETGFGILAQTEPALTGPFEGIETSDGYRAVVQLLKTGVRAVEAELRCELDVFYEITRESLSAIWPAVQAVADALLAEEQLEGERLNAVFPPMDIYRPVFAIQRVHGLLPPPGARDDATGCGRSVDSST